MSLEELDQKRAFWVANCPYNLKLLLKRKYVDQGPSVQRTYICDLSEVVTPEERKHNPEFQSDSTLPEKYPTQTFYFNGRHFYFVSSLDYSDLFRYRPTSLTQPITPESEKEKHVFPWNPLYKLICTGFRKQDIIPDLKRRDIEDCTDYGSKIAKSVIKIAATRIFAEPEQSIVELPVNSIDSYTALRNAAIGGSPSGTIGKFGMGFFSILYWLVDHPLRFLEIESYHEGAKLSCVIRQRGSELGFSFTIEDMDVVTDGTYVSLNCERDPFTNHNVQEFKKQLGKLKYIVSDLIAYRESTSEMFHPWNQPTRGETQLFVQVNNFGITVEDYAQGISLETLLTKLFVPSVSTKTIQASIETGVEEESKQGEPSLIVPNNLPHNNFVILVQYVAIVSLPFFSNSTQKYDVIMHMPSNVRIPVSRDDIIITERTLFGLMYSFRTLLEECKVLRNVAVLQLALKAYLQYTTLVDNRQYFVKLLEDSKLEHKINVQEEYVELLSTIPTVADVIVASVETSQLELIQFLDTVPGFDSNVFWGKKVFYVSSSVLKGSFSSNAGLSSYLFVDNALPAVNPETWKQQLALTSFTDRLVLLESVLEVEMNDKYREFIVNNMEPPSTEKDYMFLNILSQLVLKMLSLLDIYEVKEMKYSSENFPNSNFVLLKASGTLWFDDRSNPSSKTDQFLFAMLSDLIFYYKIDAGNSIYYMFNLYESVDTFIIKLPRVIYGFKLFVNISSQILTHTSGKHFQTQLTCEFTSNPVLLSDVFQLFEKFDVLKSYLVEHASLTVQASNSTISEVSKKVILWSHYNPLSLVMRSSIFYNTTLELSLGYDLRFKECEDEYFRSYYLSSHFILFYIKKRPSYPLFFVVTMFVQDLFMDDIIMNLNLIHMKAGMTPGYQLLYNTVFPRLLEFLEQFTSNNISNLTEFVKRCLLVPVFFRGTGQIYNSEIECSEFILLNEKLQTSFKLVTPYIFGNQEALPLFDLSTVYPRPSRVPVYRFTTSKFINYVLTQNDLTTLFQSVENYKPKTLVPLQLTEIAINEGSTKTFTEAMMIETVQNSVDAIRLKMEKEPVNSTIHLFLQESEEYYMYRITDFVGIPKNGLLSLMIPFLSTKVASQFVTGEMGSGFFNLYRGSAKVVVYTTVNGESTLIVDTPIKDSDGRVIDLDKQVCQYLEERGNQTDIYVFIEKERDLLATVITDMLHFIKNTVSLIPLLVPEVSIQFNDETLLLNGELLQETPLFKSYFCTNAVVESYLFTKSVPFLPLEKFVINSNLVPHYMIPFLKKNIVMNVQHGVYTPVQTRAKINISPKTKEAFEQFVVDTVYYAALKTITNFFNAERQVSNDMNNYLHNFTSKASLNQVLPYVLEKPLDVKNAQDFQRFMMYYCLQGVPDFALLINESSHIMRNRKFEDLSENDILSIRSLTPLSLQADVLLLWLSKKNNSGSTGSQGLSYKYINPLDSNSYMLVHFFVETFVKEYWNQGRLLELPGSFSLKDPPEVFIEKIDDTTKGFYSNLNHTLHLNKEMLISSDNDGAAIKQFVAWLKTVQNPSDVQKMYNNTVFDEWFKCSYPARTVIHELEHARQINKNHNLQGAHDDIMLQFPNSENKLYSFDKAALAVYSYIASRPNFWPRIIEKVKDFVEL